MHGSRSPQAKRKAAERLAEAGAGRELRRLETRRRALEPWWDEIQAAGTDPATLKAIAKEMAMTAAELRRLAKDLQQQTRKGPENMRLSGEQVEALKELAETSPFDLPGEVATAAVDGDVLASELAERLGLSPARAELFVEELCERGYLVPSFTWVSVLNDSDWEGLT